MLSRTGVQKLVVGHCLKKKNENKFIMLDEACSFFDGKEIVEEVNTRELKEMLLDISANIAILSEIIDRQINN